METRVLEPGLPSRPPPLERSARCRFSFDAPQGQAPRWSDADRAGLESTFKTGLLRLEHHVDAQLGIAAEVEEIVASLDAVQAQDLLPDFREDALHFRQRRLMWHGQRRGRLKIMEWRTAALAVPTEPDDRSFRLACGEVSAA